MTAEILPENPDYCFVPALHLGAEVQQVRIVFAGMTRYVPTALVALIVDDTGQLCDRLYRRIGCGRDEWTAIGAASMRGGRGKPGGEIWN